VSDIRVLVVDDQPIYRSALAGLLEVVGGYTVVGEADSGEQAVEQARALEPDLVLMDLRLPGMDGWAATQVIRSQGNAPEVVVISTDVDALAAAAVPDSGALTAVAKADLDPEWLAELQSRLRREPPPR
jgi:DNA-binding NarL/FixJ family response regulator